MIKINDYVMPHALDRIGQMETIEAVKDWYANRKEQYMILSAPTGLGKTSVVAYLSIYTKVLALARTKVLLDSVYVGDYGFDQLTGKWNHPCRYSPDTHKADVCSLEDAGITKEDRYMICEGSGACSYYVQLEKFKQSHRAVTTYAKYITDKKARNDADLYVFDEAHELPEMVIEEAGLNIDTKNTRSYPLKGFGDLNNESNMLFDDAIKIMRHIYATALKNKPVPKGSNMSPVEYRDHKRRLLRHNKFLDRIQSVAQLMKLSEAEGSSIWHYSSTSSGLFSARPMTAAYDFKRIMNTNDKKTLLMSATITPFIIDMLGIDEDNFIFYEAPQQFPATMRPIYDLGHSGMGHTALSDNPVLYNIQAVTISNVLKLRPDVSSVILTTSKYKTERLGNLLKNLGHDVFIPPTGAGTDIQLRLWENYRKPGAVCVSWNFWEGVSLNEDKMLFLAGVKYPDLSSDFERARANRSWSEFNYRAGVYAVQGAGRIQRGHFSDYLPLGNKLVFIVDGNYKRIASYAPGDFAERIVPWPGHLP